MDSLLFRHPDSPVQLPPQVGSLCSTQKGLTNITQHQYFPTQTGTLCPHGHLASCAILVARDSPVLTRPLALHSRILQAGRLLCTPRALVPTKLSFFPLKPCKYLGLDSSSPSSQKHFAPSLLETQCLFFLNAGAATFLSLSKSLKTLFPS